MNQTEYLKELKSFIPINDIYQEVTLTYEEKHTAYIAALSSVFNGKTWNAAEWLVKLEDAKDMAYVLKAAMARRYLFIKTGKDFNNDNLEELEGKISLQ